MSLDYTTIGTPSDGWPVVTAVVNTYKRPVLLARALNSILAQDFKLPWELIVVHDGPIDGETTAVYDKYLELFEQRGIRANFTDTEECSGYQCVPKNIAIQYAEGDYIAYLDDDNEWTPDHLTVLHAAIEEGTVWPDFTYGRREYVLDSPPEEGLKLPEGPSPFIPFDHTAAARLASPSTNFIDTSDALIAKGALWRLFVSTGSMWNEKLRRFGDWELFARGVVYGGWRGIGVNRIVQRYHWHGANLQLTRPLAETPELQRNTGAA